MVNAVLAVLFSVPWTPPAAAVSTGKFCRLFGPVSPSPESLAVRPLLQEIDAATRVGEDVVAQDPVTGSRADAVTPARPFQARVLGSPDTSPPMVLFDPLLIWMPSTPLPSTFGCSRRPMTLPMIRLRLAPRRRGRCRAVCSPQWCFRRRSRLRRSCCSKPSRSGYRPRRWRHVRDRGVRPDPVAADPSCRSWWRRTGQCRSARCRK